LNRITLLLSFIPQIFRLIQNVFGIVRPQMQGYFILRQKKKVFYQNTSFNAAYSHSISTLRSDG
ncbi:hypothetical protein, partial [uncultured Imperialibacter sp.]|uniref:hypothetical protein n=1 Tax=uncultured Imperialibacter sp. TaxID=1672639 RepID=UPI0030DC41D7